MRITILLFLLFGVIVNVSANAAKVDLTIELQLPDITADPYHKPYVAAWLETPKRKGVHTFLFWAEQEEWFKDLRQWWRKIGRKKKPNYDAVTGATRKPGVYSIHWNGTLIDGSQIKPGEYVLHFESVREQGSREYLRQKITIGGKPQTFILDGQTELGRIAITIK